MTKIERPCKIGFVPLGLMTVRPATQRKLRPHRVAALLADFDINDIGVPSVNASNGQFHVMDGQHRVEALKIWLGEGWEDQKIECNIYDDLSEQQEAARFLRLNNTLSVPALVRFHVALAAGNTRETEIAAVVQAAGLGVAGGAAKGGIQCVATLYKIYARSGHNGLRRTLAIVSASYGDPGFKALVFDGTSLLVHRYDELLDDQRTIRALKGVRGGVVGLIGTAEILREKTRDGLAVCVAAATVDAYNRTKGKKLTKWWRSE